MTAVTPLIDTLLATRLAQRLDLLTLKGQTQVGQAQPAVPIDKATNETRLPSRAALAELASRPAGATHAGSAGTTGGTGGAAAPAGGASATALSEAARAIGIVLRDAGARTAPAVQGAVPIWTSQLPPSAPLLAKALALAVSTSGLFYESHLKQLASGTRSLADLRREPQALLAPAPRALFPIGAARAGSGPVLPLTSVPVPVPVPAGAAAQELPAPVLESAVVLELQVPEAESEPPARGRIPRVDTQPAAVLDQDGTKTASEPPARLPPAGAHVAAAYGAGEVRGGVVASHVAGDAHSAVEAVATGPGVEPDLGATAAATAIHPDTITLVHQQLDLLELAIFRWSGEAWTGVRMEWEIRQDAEHRKLTEEELVENTWSTTLQLSLPVLGALEVRLSLGTAGAQARVLARTGRAIEWLSASGDSLAQRLREAGLPLVGYQVLIGAPSADSVQ